ncbi:MAG: nucleotidyltransferase domain-containing protein [Armatimonadota bacterium]
MQTLSGHTQTYALLRELLRINGSSARLSISDEEWRALLGASEELNVVPALFQVAKERKNVPQEILNGLSKRQNTALTANIILLNELDRTLEAVAASFVPVILLKGASFFKHHGWPPSIRSMTDLDLLVHQEHLTKTAVVLKELGFVEEPGDLAPGFSSRFLGECSFIKTTARPCRLDLHQRLFLFGAARSENSAVWQRSVPVAGAPETVRALSLEDELHYLAFHLTFHHRGSGLRWELDIARLIHQYRDGIDWDALLATAWRCRTGLAVRSALEAAVSLGAGVPSEVMEQLRAYRPTRGERLFWELVMDERFTWHARTLALLPSIKGMRGKTAYLRAKLFPSAEYAERAYGSPQGAGKIAAAKRMIGLLAKCGVGVRLALKALMRG